MNPYSKSLNVWVEPTSPYLKSSNTGHEAENSPYTEGPVNEWGQKENPYYKDTAVIDIPSTPESANGYLNGIRFLDGLWYLSKFTWVEKKHGV